ncbi:hypothetical protein E3P84_02989 [Wallemia ichthyophaga]|nr:hypothetical protein E3P84_02989 [Wallemia ichthyophaga]TIB40439.1 hypothetical protein E3P83_02932 [Wallemia ichthyophaga]
MEEAELAQFNLSIVLPLQKQSKKQHHQHQVQPQVIQIMTLPKETCLDLAQAVHESSEGYNVGAFSFRDLVVENGKHLPSSDRLTDNTQVAKILENQQSEEKKLFVVLEDYSDIDLRHHVIRFREAAVGPSTDTTNLGIESGLSVVDYVQPPSAQEDPSFDLKDDHSFQQYDVNSVRPMSKLLPKDRNKELQQSVRSFSLSHWNPPPPQCRLKGHVLYLQLTTLEGEIFHITATKKGFHVNKCTSSHFDGSMKPANDVTGGVSYSHSLFDLTSKLSNLYNAKFTPIFSESLNLARDPFAIVQIPQALPAHPWLVGRPQHLPDGLRTQSAYLLTGSTALEGLEGARDWNDELQSTKEATVNTYHERITREKLLQKLYADFSLAAVRGVVAVSRGEVPPLNPSEQTYVHANILYTPAQDAKAAGREVIYHRFLNTIDAPGLSVLATIAVDYAGKRWTAQSVVPGLLRRQEREDNGEEVKSDSNKIVYGVDELNGKGSKEIKYDKAFAELLEPVSRALRFANKKLNVDGEEVEFTTNLKGLIGGDTRRYIVEPSRMTCPDVMWDDTKLNVDSLEEKVEKANAPTYPYATFLRQEALEAYSEYELRKRSRDAVERARNEGIEKGIFPKPTEKQVTDGEEQNQEDVVPPPSSADIEKAINDGKITVPQIGNLTFNPDVNGGENDESVEAVKNASAYITETLIPLLVLDVVHGNNIPADGGALTAAMHQKGINMRHLGNVVEAANQHRNKKSILGPAFGVIDCFKGVIKQEMILRAAKHLLRKYMESAEFTTLQLLLSHFLNCLLGTDLNLEPTAESPKDDFGDDIITDKSVEWFNLTPKSLFEKLQKEVAVRFRFSLTEKDVKNIRKPQMLRELALRVGFQLELRDYRFSDVVSENVEDVNFDSNASKKAIKKAKAAAQAQNRALSGLDRSTTFVPSDVLEIVPLVKDSAPRSTICDDAFEHGRLAFQTGAAGFINPDGETQSVAQNREAGLDLMYEGVSLFEQIYTPLHAEVAKAFNGYVVAKHQMIRSASKEESDVEAHEQCLRLQRNAVIISERTLGIDHYETLSFIQNLAHLEISAGHVHSSLKYFRYAIDLWQSIYGNDHPEIIQIYSSVGNIFQQARRFEESLKMYEIAKELSFKVYGVYSYFGATMLLRVAEQHVCVNQLKLKPAVNACKEAVKGYEEAVGKDAQEYKDAAAFLNQLTAAAVHIARVNSDPVQQNARKVVEARMKEAEKQKKDQDDLANGKAGNKTSKNVSNGTANSVNNVSQDDVDAMVKFIEGGNSSKTTSKKSKKNRK